MDASHQFVTQYSLSWGQEIKERAFERSGGTEEDEWHRVSRLVSSVHPVQVNYDCDVCLFIKEIERSSGGVSVVLYIIWDTVVVAREKKRR